MTQQNRLNPKFAAIQSLLMFTVLTFLACKATETRPVAIPPGFDWQGHRGSRGLMPENSVPAFLKALEFPEVTTLELDLVVSKENDLIVSHEPWFNPDICIYPTGDTMKRKDVDKFNTYRMSLMAIQSFDCGSIGNPRFPEQARISTHKPTLKEVVDAVLPVRPDIRWNIEIKSRPEWDSLRHPPVETFVRLVIKEIRELGIEKNTTVQSFDVRVLNAMHRFAPDIPVAFLIENMDSFASNLERLHFVPNTYSPYYLLVSKSLVQQCHAKGLKLVPWTVNDVKSMRRLVRLGVDGIITDYPDRISKVGKK